MVRKIYVVVYHGLDSQVTLEKAFLVKEKADLYCYEKGEHSEIYHREIEEILLEV